MVCRNCGSKLFEGDKFCSKCGTRVTDETLAEAQTTAAEKTEAEAQAAAAEESGNNNAKAEDTKPDTTEAAKQETTGAEPERTVPLSIPEEKPSKAKKRNKKNGSLTEKPGEKKKSIALKVILGAFGLTAVVLLVNSAKIVNYFHRTFSTPEEYYRWVESRTIDDYAKTVSEYYADYVVEYFHRYDKRVTGEIGIEVKDAGKDILELAGLAGVDLSWFEKGTFTFEENSKDNKMQSIWRLELGGQRLLSMDTVFDYSDAAAYLGFPELSKTYMTVDIDNPDFAEGFSYMAGVGPEEYAGTLELMERLYKECPDKKQMEALTARYLELFVNNIDNVKMRTGKTVRAEGITQNCTSLVIYLDKTDLQRIMTEFLEELQDDETVEDLLYQLYDILEELDMDMGYRNADDFYDGFLDEIDDIIDDMDYFITYHNELEMTVYVDNKGRIIGRTLEFPNSWDEVTISYVMPHKGSKFGYKGSITIDGEEVTLVGYGKDFGNKLSGDFTVKYEGMGIVDIAVKDFNLKSLKKGYVNGSFTVKASSGISRALDLVSSYSYLSDMTLTIDISSGKSSEKWSMELKEGRDVWGTLTVAVSRGNGKKVSVPSTRSSLLIEDNWDFEDWWDTLRWDDFIKKLDKAGLPSETIDAVENFSELDGDEVLDRLSDVMWSLLNEMM